MGTSYETVLIAADLTMVRDVLPDAGFLLPAARDRTAFMPKEGDVGYADVGALAGRISADLRVPALANEVHDSDVVTMTAFRGGRAFHRYESADLDSARGPVGADPGALAPFGAGQVDLEALGKALRGEFSGKGRVLAEFQHRLIVKAMDLDPTGLTTAYRWAGDLPGVVRTPVRDATRPTGGWQSVPVVVMTGLPLDADPDAVAQALADAVAGRETRADVAVIGVMPGAAGAWEIHQASLRYRMIPRHGTYFVALWVSPGLSPRKARKAAEKAWEATLRSRFGVRPEQGPAFVTVTAHQFEIGYNAAASYHSSRT